jgi:hypothetical protein
MTLTSLDRQIAQPTSQKFKSWKLKNPPVMLGSSKPIKIKPVQQLLVFKDTTQRKVDRSIDVSTILLSESSTRHSPKEESDMERAIAQSLKPVSYISTEIIQPTFPEKLSTMKRSFETMNDDGNDNIIGESSTEGIFFDPC